MVFGVLAAIAPVFLTMAAGYAAVRSGYVRAEAVAALSGFVLRVALPMLIVNAVAGAPLAETLNPGYLAGYAAATLGVYAVGLLWARRGGAGLPEASVQGFGMAGTNSGFVGYPVATLVIGPAAAPILAQNMVVENLLLIPAVMVLAETGGARQGSLGAALRGVGSNLVRNPLLVAVAIGIAVAAAGLRLPEWVARPVALMGGVAAPLALFVVGGTLAGLSPGQGAPAEVGRIALGKLLLHPLAVFLALVLAPGVDPLLVAGGTLFAGAPMMSIFPIIGARFGAAGVSAAALFAATLLSALTLPVLILLLGLGGPVGVG